MAKGGELIMGFFRYNLEVKAVKLYTNNQKKRIREIPQKERAEFYKWYRAFFLPMWKEQQQYRKEMINNGFIR